MSDCDTLADIPEPARTLPFLNQLLFAQLRHFVGKIERGCASPSYPTEANWGPWVRLSSNEAEAEEGNSPAALKRKRPVSPGCPEAVDARKDADPPCIPLFPPNERLNTNLRQKNRLTRYVVSEVTDDGRLLAGCQNCSCVLLAEEFMPLQRHRNTKLFRDADEAFARAYANGDLDVARDERKKLEKLRVSRCKECNQPGYVSPKSKACKDEYLRMRVEAANENGGCCNQTCPERGVKAAEVTQGNHLYPETKEKRLGHSGLSSYTQCALLGGVPFMHSERDKGMSWPCVFCHRLDPNSNSANRSIDPASLPLGNSYGTVEEVKQYNRRRRSLVVYPKLKFVDLHKRIRGCCNQCKRPVNKGEEAAFDFHHVNPESKLEGKGTLAGEIGRCGGGVAGIVSNKRPSSRLWLDRPDEDGLSFCQFKNPDGSVVVVIFVLLAEIKKCELLCACCHHRATNGYEHRPPYYWVA
jgi:hypothetical protein